MCSVRAGGERGGSKKVKILRAHYVHAPILDGASCETIGKFDVEGAQRDPNQADGSGIFSIADIDKAVDACNEHAQCKGILKTTLVQLCSDTPAVTQGSSGYGYAKGDGFFYWR